MTLREFIEKAIADNALEEDAKSIEKRVTDVARTKQKSGCAVLTDEEVMEIIMDPEAGKKAQEQKAKNKEAERTYMEKLDRELKQQLKQSPPKESPNTIRYGGGEMESLF